MRKKSVATFASAAVMLGAMNAFAVIAPADEADELVLVDNEYCTFTLKSTEVDSLWGYTWNVYLENKTDTTMMFSVEASTVNGLELDPLWATDVDAGLKKNAEISWMDDFSKYGIEDVTDVDMKLRIYDEDDWEKDPYVNEIVSYNPSGEDVVYERESEETDQVLYDDDNFSIVVSDTDVESDFGYDIELYLVNKTDKTLMFATESGALNGFDMDPFFATGIMPNTSKYAKIEWFTDTLKENGIEEVESIGLGVRVYDDEDWMAPNIVEDQFEIQP